MAFIITLPASMDTPAKRAAWAEYWRELARLAHNWMGAWSTVGKTRAQYTNAIINNNNYITRKIRLHYPFPDATSVLDGELYALPEYLFHEFQNKFFKIDAALHAIIEANMPNPAVSGMDDPILAERQAFFDAAKANTALEIDGDMTDSEAN